VSLAAVQCADALLASLNTICNDDDTSTPVLSPQFIALVNDSIKELSSADVQGACEECLYLFIVF